MSLTVSFLTGALTYIICSVIGGHIWHVVLFEDAYLSLKAWTRFDDPWIPAGVAAYALQGLLVSHMLPLYQKARGGGGIAGGAAFGLWVAGLVFSVAVLAHGANNRMACFEGFAAMEGVYCLLQFPVSCAAVAFARGRLHHPLARPGGPRKSG